MLNSHIAVDLGSSTIRIHTQDKGLVLEEPAIMAVDSETKKILAIGREAYNMFGRSCESTEFIYPFEMGVVTDLSMAEYLMARFIKNLGLGKVLMPTVSVVSSADLTQVQKNAITDVFERSGMNSVNFVNENLACVKGCDVDFKSAFASMVVNIGHRKSFATIVGNKKILATEKVEVGGLDFTYSLIQHMRKRHFMDIGFISAEETKGIIASVAPKPKTSFWHVKGKNIYSSLPQDKIVSSDETIEIFSEPMARINTIIQKCFENVSAEILTDIARNGIVLSGGGSKVYGIDKYFERKFNVPVKLCEEAEKVLVYGASF